jgi:ligand-binding sensor domain-containing protein
VKKLFILLQLLLILWCSAPLFAQQLLSRSFATTELNSHGKITSLYESKRGLLWIGCANKLFSFDGKLFEEMAVLPENEVIPVIREDHSGNILLGTKNGKVYRFLIKKLSLDTGIVFQNKTGVPISGFENGKDSSLYIATYGEGLFKVGNHPLLHYNTENELSSDDIYDIEMDSSEQIWLATDNGIAVGSNQNNTYKFKILSRSDGLKDEIITALDYSENHMWIAYYDHGIASISTANFSIVHSEFIWNKGSIKALKYHDGEISILNSSGEFILGNPKSNSFSSNLLDQELSFSIMSKGRNSKIWLLDKLKQTLHLIYPDIITYPIPADKRVQALANLDNGVFMIGHDKGIGSIGPGEIYKEMKVFAGLNVVSLFLDSEKKLWVGTLGQGLFRYELGNGSLVKFGFDQGLKNDNILAIEEDEDHFWFCTLGGIYFAHKSAKNLRFESVSFSGGPGANFIYDIKSAKDGSIWAATDGKGIKQMDHLGTINQNIPEQLKKGTYYSIALNSSGKDVWAVSANDGIYRLSGKSLANFTLENGLRSNNNNAIKIDAVGNIFAWNQYGIDAMLAGDSLFFPLWTQENQDESNVLNLFSIDRQDQIWTIHDNTLHPLHISDDENKRPGLWIHKVTCMGESVDYNEHTVFAYDENYLSFQYKGIQWNDPGQIFYRYRLLGSDTIWSYTSDKIINFSGLPPGEYNFRIQASLHPDFQIYKEDNFEFEIKPPFWNQIWFWLPLALFLATIAIAIVRNREKRIEKEASLKNLITEYRYDLLASQINPHFLFNSFNVLAALIPKEPAKAGEFLETLSDFYREIVQIKDTDIISIEKETYILDRYFYLLKQRFGDALNVNIEIEDKRGSLIPFTLQLLLENAVKHNIVSTSKPLNVSVKRAEDFIYVKNNIQAKFSASESTGFGLSSLKERYQQYSPDKFEILNDNHYFEVRIPIIHK